VSTKTKKTNATTELVLGQAAQNIKKAVAELVTATEAVKQLESKGEELTLLVANKEEAIATLDIQFKEKERQLNVDLDLSFKAHTDKVVTEYLKSVNKVAVPTSELNDMKKELDTTKANFEATVKKEVAVAVNSVKSNYESDIKLMNAEYKAKEAENLSKIGVLAEKNSFLEKQVEQLYAQLNAERSAGIERAKAGSVGSINVGSTDRK
jgi:hypothetical protein